MIYHLYYFSATGNTWRAAGKVQSALQAAGHSVEVVSINGWTIPLAETPDRIVLLFPALSWAPPALVIRFVRKLERNHIRAAVLTTDGGGCFGAPLWAARLLRRRGFDVFLTGTSSYSHNWLQVMPAPKEEQAERNRERGDGMVDLFAKRLILEETHHHQPNPIWRALLGLVGVLFVSVGRRLLGTLFVADGDCNSCGLCERSCPVGAIVMVSRKGALPYWKLSCESCNRCVNICPTEAINSSILKPLVLLLMITGAFAGCVSVYRALLVPIIDSLPTLVFSIINFVAMIALVILAHVVALGIGDRYILRPLRGAAFLRWSFTKSFRRYRTELYKPPNETREYPQPSHSPLQY